MAKQFSKFGLNRFGICNSKGECVSEDYLRRYIHCWCRVENPKFNIPARKELIAYFMSDEFLAQHAGKTASQIGQIASLSDLWNSKKPGPKAIFNFVEASLADA